MYSVTMLSVANDLWKLDYFNTIKFNKSAVTWNSFYLHGLTLIPVFISNHIHYKMWDEIVYPFQNFNGAIVEVWELISNFISHFNGHGITYPCWD